MSVWSIEERFTVEMRRVAEVWWDADSEGFVAMSEGLVTGSEGLVARSEGLIAEGEGLVTVSEGLIAITEIRNAGGEERDTEKERSYAELGRVRRKMAVAEGLWD